MDECRKASTQKSMEEAAVPKAFYRFSVLALREEGNRCDLFFCRFGSILREASDPYTASTTDKHRALRICPWMRVSGCGFISTFLCCFFDILRSR